MAARPRPNDTGKTRLLLWRPEGSTWMSIQAEAAAESAVPGTEPGGSPTGREAVTLRGAAHQRLNARVEWGGARV